LSLIKFNEINASKKGIYTAEPVIAVYGYISFDVTPFNSTCRNAF